MFFSLTTGKQQLLTRPRFESITRTLSRLLKFVKKSKSPKKTEPLVRTRRSAGVQGVREEVVSCEVDLHYPDESNVDLNTFQNDHIVSGLYFTMDATTFTFIRDPPLTRSMQLFPRAVVLKGYPLVLTISSELSDGVDCDWYSCLDNEEMIHVGTGETFYPTDVCVGRRLKAVCTPWRWDTDTKNSIKKKKSSDGLDHNTGDARIVEDIDSINSTTVQNESDTSMTLKNTANNNDTIERQQDKDRKRILGRPAVCYSATKVFLPISQSAILEVRKDFIELKRVQNTVTLIGDSKGVTGGGDVMSKDNDDSDNRNNSSREDVRGDKELRVMTFNTLAEPFATSRYAKENIYLYCDNDHLDTEYRAQLVGLELLSYDADVMCLQECDAKTYKSYYYPLLSERGYDLHYTNKVSYCLHLNACSQYCQCILYTFHMLLLYIIVVFIIVLTTAALANNGWLFYFLSLLL